MRTLSEYCLETFGEKLYRLSLNGGMTCPNRDGRCGVRGCIFCSAGGSGEFAGDAALPIPQQIEREKTRVAKKFRGHGYIAYFQAYTNTYAPVDRLRRLFTQAMEPPEIKALSIATRPDCLGDDVLYLLEELSRVKPVWVELGLQSIHPRTAQYIRRGYPLSVFDEAMAALKARGIPRIVHLILGLPGEREVDMLQSVRYVGNLGAEGVKLQMLNVLSGTDLEKEYLAGRVPLMGMDEYVDLIGRCARILPPDIVAHRLTGDGPRRLLIAPLWCLDKKRVLNKINEILKNQ